MSNKLMHCCGWEGSHSDIILDYIEGIFVGGSCPKCGGEYPLCMFEQEESYQDYLAEKEYEEEWKPKTRDRKYNDS